MLNLIPYNENDEVIKDDVLKLFEFKSKLIDEDDCFL
jgi:hypothetical protein